MKPMRLIPPLTILAASLAVGTAHADDFAAMTPQSRDLTVAGGHTALTIGRTPTYRLTEAGALTVMVR
jgi:hypothetical protein